MENQIKVTMDRDRLQIAANVDAKGARNLLKAIQANLNCSVMMTKRLPTEAAYCFALSASHVSTRCITSATILTLIL